VRKFLEMTDNIYQNHMGKSKDLIYSLLLYLYITAFYAHTMSDIPDILIQIPLYGLILCTLLKIIFNNELIPTQFAIWYGLFLMISLASFFYSSSQSYALIGIERIITSFILVFSISVFISNDVRKERLIYFFIYSGLIFGTYHVLNSIINESNLRIGLEYGVNPNEVGLVFSISCCFAFFKLYQKEKVILNTLGFIVSFLSLLLSGSKSAILGIIIYLFILLLFTQSIKNLTRNVVVLSAILIGVYYLLMNNTFFYNIAGYRIEAMLMLFFNEGANDGSTGRRLMMIQEGLEFFYNKPMFGAGINNFANIYNLFVGEDTYSHNNYVEILVNLGIVGFLIYYGVFIYIGRKLISSSNRDMVLKGHSWAILVLILFYDMATVSYYSPFVIMLITLLLNNFLIKRNKEIF